MNPRLAFPLLLIVLVAGMLWLRGADERRVNHACDSWLEHRGSLRWVLSETDEAVGRAQAQGKGRVSEDYNDIDRTLGYLDEWRGVGPAVRKNLDGSRDASGLERGADSAFGFVDEGLDVLADLIQNGSPSEVADWLPEMSARFQTVDDVCLAAAR